MKGLMSNTFDINYFRKMLVDTGLLTSLIPFTKPEMIHNSDVVIFSGGEDITPEIYGERNTDSYTNFQRDLVDVFNFNLAVANEKKVIGVCRGHQFVNGVLGGKLIQNIEPGHNFLHEVYSTSFGEEIGFEEITMVNSTHHQGVKEVAPFVDQLLVSSDGIIEATMVGNKIFSTQFHPEYYNFPAESKVIYMKILEKFLHG